jgi:hypothetical protein
MFNGVAMTGENRRHVRWISTAKAAFGGHAKVRYYDLRGCNSGAVARRVSFLKQTNIEARSLVAAPLR